jgi:uncharacterized protein
MTQGLRFPLTEVKEIGESPVDVSVPGGEFPGIVDAGELIGAIRIKGLISEQDEDAVFEGDARGRWRLECTRCLVPVEADFTSPFEQRVSIDAGPMDLTEEVRQAIVLAQPMKIYCRPHCRGLCPVCRKNRNVTDCGHDKT